YLPVGSCACGEPPRPPHPGLSCGCRPRQPGARERARFEWSSVPGGGVAAPSSGSGFVRRPSFGASSLLPTVLLPAVLSACGPVFRSSLSASFRCVRSHGGVDRAPQRQIGEGAVDE